MAVEEISGPQNRWFWVCTHPVCILASPSFAFLRRCLMRRLASLSPCPLCQPALSTLSPTSPDLGVCVCVCVCSFLNHIIRETQTAVLLIGKGLDQNVDFPALACWPNSCLLWALPALPLTLAWHTHTHTQGPDCMRMWYRRCTSTLAQQLVTRWWCLPALRQHSRKSTLTQHSAQPRAACA